jgi:hypothetical protein
MHSRPYKDVSDLRVRKINIYKGTKRISKDV